MCPPEGNSEPAQGRLGRCSLSPIALSSVPKHPAAQASLTLAQSLLPASIFNHSFRVYLYAKAFLYPSSTIEYTLPSSPVETGGLALHVLFTACMLHDISIVDEYDATPERFEVVSADEAAQLLRQHDVDEQLTREAWLAMALHSTPGIGERLPGMIKALRQAIMAEFGALAVPTTGLTEDEQAVIDNDLPRLDIEKELGHAVVRQALITPNKAPKVSWPGVMLQATKDNPEWGGVNKAFWDCA